MHSTLPRKIPEWVEVIRENFSVKRQAYRKLTTEVVLHVFLSVFFFKFYI